MKYSEDDLKLLKTITLCLEQKVLFMTNIFNLTKKIEVSVGEEEVDFDSAFEQRQDNMNRIDKCNALINATAAQLNDDIKASLQDCLQGHSSEDKTLNSIVSQVLEYNKMLAVTRELDVAATTAFKERYGDLKDKLNVIRKSKLANNPANQDIGSGFRTINR